MGCADLKREVIQEWKHDEQNVGQLVGAGSSGACEKGPCLVGLGLHCYSQSILRVMLMAAPPGGALDQDQRVQREQRRRSWELKETLARLPLNMCPDTSSFLSTLTLDPNISVSHVGLFTGPDKNPQDVPEGAQRAHTGPGV